MPIETFIWDPSIDATGDISHRVRKAQFGDGYAQVIGDGINSKSQSWPLAFTGTGEEVIPIRDFLDLHAGGKAFLWSPPLEGVQLYRCATYQLVPLGGDLYTLNATFEQAFHP